MSPARRAYTNAFKQALLAVVFVKLDLLHLLDCYGTHRRAVIKVQASGVWGTAVCFRLKSFS